MGSPADLDEYCACSVWFDLMWNSFSVFVLTIMLTEFLDTNNKMWGLPADMMHVKNVNASGQGKSRNGFSLTMLRDDYVKCTMYISLAVKKVTPHALQAISMSTAFGTLRTVYLYGANANSEHKYDSRAPSWISFIIWSSRLDVLLLIFIYFNIKISSKRRAHRIYRENVKLHRLFAKRRTPAFKQPSFIYLHKFIVLFFSLKDADPDTSYLFSVLIECDHLFV